MTEMGHEFEIKTTVAALTSDLTEHARCERHGTGEHFLAIKPLRWAEAWGPR